MGKIHSFNKYLLGALSVPGPVKGIGHTAVNRYGRNVSLVSICSSAINCFLSSAVSFHWSPGHDAAESTAQQSLAPFPVPVSSGLLFLGNTSLASHSASLISSVPFTNPHPFPLDSDFHPNSVACQDVPDSEGPPSFPGCAQSSTSSSVLLVLVGCLFLGCGFTHFLAF